MSQYRQRVAACIRAPGNASRLVYEAGGLLWIDTEMLERQGVCAVDMYGNTWPPGVVPGWAIITINRVPWEVQGRDKKRNRLWVEPVYVPDEKDAPPEVAE